MAAWDSAERKTRTPYSHPWLAEAVAALDARLRHRQAVFEYTSNPSCIFRLDIGAAPRLIILRDGTCAHPGERLARLHFWNEQIPSLPQQGATIGWARRMQRAIVVSLVELAHYLASRPDLDDISIVGGDVPSATEAQREQLARIMTRYGFEAVVEPERLPFGGRLNRLGENILISLIVFTHNARALRPDTLRRVRLPIYLSRRLLEKEFGGRRAERVSP